MDLTNLAKRIKQKGNTCVLASMVFSLLSREIHEKIYTDIRPILTNCDGYKTLKEKICRGDEPLEINTLADYLSSHGYEVKLYPYAEISTIEQNIELKPLISLKFTFPQWLDFFGKGNLNNWYSAHVICGVDVRSENLIYFEPLTGEIREKDLSQLEEYDKGICLIKLNS
ncbi:MAG: hypothetical protein J7K72_00825 [Candidatus Aenigmarchaeota archaeon]|nr:hypothetical protein [Candidatus Aenigmarchaeota archaeon]